MAIKDFDLFAISTLLPFKSQLKSKSAAGGVLTIALFALIFVSTIYITIHSPFIQRNGDDVSSDVIVSSLVKNETLLKLDSELLFYISTSKISELEETKPSEDGIYNYSIDAKYNSEILMQKDCSFQSPSQTEIMGICFSISKNITTEKFLNERFLTFKVKKKVELDNQNKVDSVSILYRYQNGNYKFLAKSYINNGSIKLINLELKQETITDYTAIDDSVFYSIISLFGVKQGNSRKNIVSSLRNTETFSDGHTTEVFFKLSSSGSALFITIQRRQYYLQLILILCLIGGLSFLFYLSLSNIGYYVNSKIYEMELLNKLFNIENHPVPGENKQITESLVQPRIFSKLDLIDESDTDIDDSWYSKNTIKDQKINSMDYFKFEDFQFKDTNMPEHRKFSSNNFDEFILNANSQSSTLCSSNHNSLATPINKKHSLFMKTHKHSSLTTHKSSESSSKKRSKSKMHDEGAFNKSYSNPTHSFIKLRDSNQSADLKEIQINSKSLNELDDFNNSSASIDKKLKISEEGVYIVNEKKTESSTDTQTELTIPMKQSKGKVGKLSYFEFMFSCFRSKKVSKEDINDISRGLASFKKEIDIVNIYKTMNEVEILKYLLLDADQLNLFNALKLKKKILNVNEEKGYKKRKLIDVSDSIILFNELKSPSLVSSLSKILSSHQLILANDSNEQIEAQTDQNFNRKINVKLLKMYKKAAKVNIPEY